jgi:hypothetical protein
MIPIDREIRRLLFLATLVVAGCATPAAFGQDEELIDDGPMLPPAPMFGAPAVIVQTVNPDQVDQWVFGRWGGSAAARARMDANLTLRIDDIDRACSVSEVQKKKLKLAGLGDIKRYFDRVEDLKRKFVRSANAPNNNIWQEMQPLQMELNTGFFGEDSIFVKTIKKTLDDDQAKRYDSLLHRRGLERRRATVEWFVVHIDKALGLTEDERGRLVELLLSETPPPNRYGQGDFWYLMYQMSRLPEAKIKSIVDEPQWRLLSRQFMQARGMEPWLRSNGIIAGDAKATPSAATKGAIQVRRRNVVAAPVPVPVAPVAVPKN